MSEVDDFTKDDYWQLMQRDRFLPPFYLSEGIDFQFLPHDIKGYGKHPPDTLWRRRGKLWIPVEEKIVRWPGYHYGAYAIEVMSCINPGHESDGWIFNSDAEILLYAFHIEPIDQLRVHLLPLPELKEWFWQNHERFPKSISKQFNRSLCRVVDIAEVRDAGIEIEQFLLSPARVAA